MCTSHSANRVPSRKFVYNVNWALSKLALLIFFLLLKLWFACAQQSWKACVWEAETARYDIRLLRLQILTRKVFHLHRQVIRATNVYKCCRHITMTNHATLSADTSALATKFWCLQHLKTFILSTLLEDFGMSTAAADVIVYSVCRH